MKTSEVLAKVRTKQQMAELMETLLPNFNETGLAIATFIIESVKENDGKNVTLASLKNDAKELLDEVQSKYFKNNPKLNKGVLFENSVKKLKSKKKTTTEDVKATDEEAEALVNAISKDKKEDKKASKDDKLTNDEVFKLCGYRYTYPEFPKTFKSEVIKGSRFERIDTSDVNEINAMYNEYFSGQSDYQLVSVMYFPDYERDYDIDPHYALGIDANKKELLKTFGGKYPQNLDIQSIVSFNPTTRVLVTVSELTGVPYAIACSKKWFTTNDKLHCRVTQNGLDYQLYKVYKEE